MKLVIAKSKNKEFLYIRQSFRKQDGKCSSKNVQSLGSIDYLMTSMKLSREEVIAWGEKQAQLATEAFKEDNKDIVHRFSQTSLIPINTQTKFNCGYLFIQKLLSSIRLKEILNKINKKHRFHFDLNEITKDLIYARFIEPSSKRSAYKIAQTFLEEPKYSLHDIYRALPILASESDFIQSRLYENTNFIGSRNKEILYFDATNYYFEVEQEDDLRKYGKSKEHRPNPIVQMGLFMDGDGIPLYFNIFPGNQNEQTTLIPMEKTIIQDFHVSEFIFCSDAGLASKKNKLFNSFDHRKYVITQSIKKMKKEDKAIVFNPKQWRVIGSHQMIDISKLDETDEKTFNTVFYKEIPVTIKGLEENVIVTYSPKYKAYQEKVRQKQLDRALNMIESETKIKKKRRNLNDPARFIKETVTTKDGEVAENKKYEIDISVFEEEAIYDGFYAVSTNLDADVSRIIRINQQRWKIEESFRLMKTDFDTRPVHVSRQDSIKAHFLICFLTLLVYRLMEKQLEYQYTTEELLKTVRDMELTYINGSGYIPTYTRTNITDKLHEYYGFRTDYEITTKEKIRKIINYTKKG